MRNSKAKDRLLRRSVRIADMGAVIETGGVSIPARSQFGNREEANHSN
jgi:hypothetical protein